MNSIPNIELFSLNASTVSPSPTVPETSSKIESIALSIFLGGLAIVGASLLAAGTIASLGSLPVILVIVATVISGIASGCFGMVAFGKTSQPDLPKNEVMSLPSIEEEKSRELELIETILSAHSEIPFDAAHESYLEKVIPTSSQKIKIHKRFYEDLFRNRARISIEGKSLAQIFSKENSELDRLEKIRISVDDDLMFQLDCAEQVYEVYKVEFSEKIGQEFMKFISRKLGEEGLIAPISAALSQYVASDLNCKMMELSSKNMEGILQPRKDLKSKGALYSLEFPKGNQAAAKITVTDDAEFDEIVDGCKRSKLTLNDKNGSIKYTGKATVMVGFDGNSTIETFVKLVPGMLNTF